MKKLKNYYINTFGFSDIHKDGSILFISLKELTNWYLALIYTVKRY